MPKAFFKFEKIRRWLGGYKAGRLNVLQEHFMMEVRWKRCMKVYIQIFLC